MSSVTRFGDFLHFGNFLKALATINLPKSPTFLGNFCEGVKIYHFSSEIIFGNFCRYLAIFFSGHTAYESKFPKNGKTLPTCPIHNMVGDVID